MEYDYREYRKDSQAVLREKNSRREKMDHFLSSEERKKEGREPEKKLEIGNSYGTFEIGFSKAADDTTEDQQKADRKPAENPQKSTNKNVKNVKNDKKAHTRFFSGKDKTRAREVSQKAQDMLRWIETHTPSVQLMEFPITLRQAQAIVERMDDEDIIRILTDMCNKGATKRCRSAINTFNSYASRDFILKEKREKARNHEAIQRGFVKK